MHSLLRSRSVAAGLLACALAAAPVSAQRSEQAPRLLLDKLGLHSATVQELILPWTEMTPFETRIVIDGVSRLVVLEPHSLRAEDFQLVSIEADGSERSLEVAPPTTYRGSIVGIPGSVVAASLYQGQLSGIAIVDGHVWGIQPATEGLAWLPRAAHVVYRQDEAVLENMSCGSPHEAGPSLGDSLAGADGLTEIAAELEPRFQAIWGGQAGAINQAEAIINGMDAIYQAQTDVSYVITRLVFREGYATNTTTVLSRMASIWGRPGIDIRHDCAHLFMGNPSSGIIGVAYLATICTSSKYSVSWHTSSMIARVAVTSHELGHSWSAGHCDGFAQCFIMCSGIGGCSGVLTAFAPVSINAINSFAATRTCLN